MDAQAIAARGRVRAWSSGEISHVAAQALQISSESRGRNFRGQGQGWWRTQSTLSSSRRARASLKSGVSNPSANQS
jgi:hypothetical protein